ncbi:MAG TPA: conjugal transfer protein TraF [Vicinamibacterales bacterium]|nr:conjugal transfer protein TraF [Vicinamibacterales bacterium]
MLVRCVAILLTAGALSAPTLASAQQFESVGTRAAGLGGAFVAVADDASAVYWNPAGLASGGFFSLLLDSTRGEGKAPDAGRAASRSGTILALGTPPLGLTYYRLRSSGVVPADAPDARPGDLRAFSLITHHAGATLVQSLTDTIAVATTLKFVRGIAAIGQLHGLDLDDALDVADDLVGSGENTFDADLGILAIFGRLRAGLSVRNVTQPEFEIPFEEGALELERLTRAGLAYAAAPGLLVALDVDLERASDALGEARQLAVGAEARIHPRASLRTGFRFNTLGDQPGGRAPVGTVGGSYAVLGWLFAEGQITYGSESGSRGWGLAGRVAF